MLEKKEGKKEVKERKIALRGDDEGLAFSLSLLPFLFCFSLFYPGKKKVENDRMEQQRHTASANYPATFSYSERSVS